MLPIHEIRSQLQAIVRSRAGTPTRIVLQAPTGSGKSTQIPQFLIDDALVPAEKQVVVLQPRRLPTRMLAARIASERHEKLGETVGYQIRFDRVESAGTRIKFVTEGLLLRQLLADKKSSEKIGAIVFDEFHERHLYSDLTLALALDLQRRERPDLLIIVMSATLDSDALQRWLAPCELLVSDGRAFPIKIEYFSASQLIDVHARFAKKITPWEHACAAFRKVFHAVPEGDFLIFMPGAYEINRTIDALAGTPEGRECEIFPLYGELPPAAQDRAVAPSLAGTRKIVVATNVAETSLTIPGIRVVIDSGLARVARFDPHRGINMLLLEPISQSSADQRAGRAGRTAAGTCVRLWSQNEQNHRPPRDVPEIHRVELSETILLLKAGGIAEISAFPWFEKPSENALNFAIETLSELGAFDGNGALTALGKRMAAFPLHPRYARMFIAASELDCLPEIATIAALAQGRDILLNDDLARDLDEKLVPAGLSGTSDFFVRMRLLELARERKFDFGFCQANGIHANAARQAANLAEQFLKIAKKICGNAGKTAKCLGNGDTLVADFKNYPKVDLNSGDKSVAVPETLLEKNSVPAKSVPAGEAIRRCLLIGFISQLAMRMDAGTLRCKLTRSRSGELRKTSVVRGAKLLVASEIDEIQTRGDTTVFLSLATEIERAWLDEFFGDEIRSRIGAIYDSAQKRVISKSEKIFRGLVLESREIPDVPSDAGARILAEEVLAGRLKLEAWDARVEAWICKVNFAARHLPELGIAPIDVPARQMMIEEICFGATSYKEIREKSPWKTLHSWLSREQQMAMDALLPDSISLPRRRHPAKIVYTEDCEAVIGATVQELYDCAGTHLRIANGKIPLVIEVQSPARRTFQRTSDLDAFWKTSYENVKKELRGRYPKHEWR